MKFAELDTDGAPLVEGYGPTGVRVDGREYAGSLVISAQGVQTGWGPPSPDGLTAEHLLALLATVPAPPQVVILGTGRQQRFPPAAVGAALRGQGIGLEVMDTGAACRTYNILVGEGRAVIAALLADD